MQLKKLKTKYIGKNQLYFKTIDSTQKEIYRQIKNNTIINGTIVVADKQLSGIGTHGRRWFTDQENNIAFSIYVDLNTKIERLSSITIDIAKIIVKVFKNLYDIEIDIKEPNDLYLNRKKIGGILTETKLQNDIVKYMVLGVGINTNKTFFNDEIKDIATSIYNEYKVNINSEEVIEEFINNFENEIDKIKT